MPRKRRKRDQKQQEKRSSIQTEQIEPRDSTDKTEDPNQSEQKIELGKQETSKKKNYCLLKFCDTGLYNKLVDGTYVLPSDTKKINWRINILLNKEKSERGEPYRDCILCDIIGSGKSAILKQIHKKLQIKRIFNRNIKVIYIDLDRLATEIGDQYFKNPLLYSEQPDGEPREKFIEKCVFEEILKQKPQKSIVGNSTNFQGFIARLDELKKNNFVWHSGLLRPKLVILIDGLDKLLFKIYKDHYNDEIYKDGKKIDLINHLKVVKEHIVKFYETISTVHCKLSDQDIGGCLATTRDVLKPNDAGMRLSTRGWWTENTNIFVDIFIYYMNKHKPQNNKCPNKNCDLCNYKLTQEQFKFCKNYKYNRESLGSKPNEVQIYNEIKDKLLRHIKTSDKNIKRFLDPFANLGDNPCIFIYAQNNGENTIDKNLKEYYQGVGRSLRYNTLRSDGSILHTYLDLFPICVIDDDKLVGTTLALDGKEVAGTIEKFFGDIGYHRKSMKKEEWIKKIQVSICGDIPNHSEAVFNYLLDSGIFLPNQGKGGPTYRISSFIQFVYGNTGLFIKDKESGNAR